MAEPNPIYKMNGQQQLDFPVVYRPRANGPPAVDRYRRLPPAVARALRAAGLAYQAGRGIVALGRAARTTRNMYRAMRPSQGSQAARVVNKSELALASGATAVVRAGKKGKKTKKSKKLPYAKQISKMIERKMKAGIKVLMTDIETNEFKKILSEVNKVKWNTLYLQTKTTARDRLEYRTLQASGGSTSVTEIDSGNAYLGRKYYFKDSFNMHFKNNTNSPAELVVYLLRCNDYTVLSPTSEMNELRKAAFSNTQVLSKEDDFNQYWTIPRINASKRKWQIQKHWKIDMSGGEESTLFVSPRMVIFDPSVIVEEGDATYFKGQYAVVIREQGKVTHDTSTKTNLGLSNTEIDVMVNVRRKTYMQQSTVVQTHRQAANVGVALSAPTVAEPEVPNVGAFAN